MRYLRHRLTAGTSRRAGHRCLRRSRGALGIVPLAAGNRAWDQGFRRGDGQLLAVLAYATPLCSALLLALLGVEMFSCGLLTGAILVVLAGLLSCTDARQGSVLIFVVATHPGLGVVAVAAFVAPQRRQIDVVIGPVHHVDAARIARIGMKHGAVSVL